MKIRGIVSILMPAFNESEDIDRNLREVVDTFTRFAEEFEVILIDDGSGDETYLYAARVSREFPDIVRVVRYDVNEGKGNALVVGSSYVRGEYVVFMDADMDLHPSQLPVFFEIMERENADVVVGSKWHPKSQVTYPPVRRLYSLGYFALTRLLFGLPLRDTQTGLKLFRTSLIRDVIPRVLSKRFAYDVELLAVAHRRGYRIVDAPVRLGISANARAPALRCGLADVPRHTRRVLPPEFLTVLRSAGRAACDPDAKRSARASSRRMPGAGRRQSHRGRGPALSAGTADRKHIVFFGWRDLRDPRAGGAEYYAHDLLATLARAGFRCTLFVSRAKGQPDREEREYYTVIRKGNRVTCRFHAAAWLARNRDDVDCVVDELSTLPFLSRLVARDKTVVLVHQLAREVWWFEAPAPIAAVGFALEPLMVQIYRSAPAITVSKSSAASLREIGLRGPIEIIENPLEPPVEAASAFVRGRIGFVGRLTPSKRVDHIVRAFGMLAARWPKAELWIVGGGEERTLASLRALAKRLGCEDRVRFTGHVPGAERDAILASLDCLVMASAREGWGRVVSEAARYGVP